MRTPPRPGPLRRTAQRGAALLIALLTVTLVATFAATALWQQWRVTEIEAAERARLQSAWVLVGALDWARLALREDRDRQRDDLTEPWAIPLAEARLSSFLAADKNVASDELAGLPDAFLSGQITDAQSKLNVRNLVQGGQPAKATVDAFLKLFEMLGLPPEQVMLMVRGLTQALPVTTTGTPSPESPAPLAPNPEGAADAPLMPQRLPQLAWFGLPASTIAVITPYVTLLPSGSNAATAININTASAEVMAAALPGLDLAGAQRVLARRQGQPFAKLSEADELLPEENVRFTASGLFDVKSSFFETVGRLRLDKHWVEEHALVQRSTTHLTVIWRERGAGATLNPSGS